MPAQTPPDPASSGPRDPLIAEVFASHADPRDVFSDSVAVALPMRTRFRGLTSRETLLVRGPLGWAEFAPFPEYDDAEASTWLCATVEWACVGPPPALTGTSVVPANATVPAVPVQAVAAILERQADATCVKIKIAEHGIGSLAHDLERIAEVRRLAPTAALRLDANAAYSLAQAQDVCEALVRGGLGAPANPAASSSPCLQYLEQPTASVEDLARLREWLALRQWPIAIAADESIRRSSDPARIAQLGAADVIIVKCQPLGGIRRVHGLVESLGLPAVVSSALESSVGLAAGAHLAASLSQPLGSSLGALPASGLATATMFSADVTPAPLIPERGHLPLGRVAADPASLARLAMPPQRSQWWQERLRRCWSQARTRDRH